MALRELRLTDLQLSACSLWTAPDGTQYLPVPHTIPFYYQVKASAFVPDVELGTPPKYDFLCKVVSAANSQTATPSLITPTVQIQWPDGRYLSNPGIQVFGFIGTGANGRLISPHKLLRANSKIRHNIDNTQASTPYQLQMFYEGCLLVPLVEIKGAA